MKTTLSAVGAAMLAFTLMLTGAPPAHGQAAHIYGVVPAWGGWGCQWPDYLAFVGYANHSVRNGNGGDSGDDIVWIPVNLNRDNHITMTAKCAFGNTFPAMNYVIKPTRNKQTFWFRLNGTFKNN